MIRLVVLLLIIAGVAGYFTRPDEPKMSHAADAVLQDPQNLGQAVGNVIAGVSGDRRYDNYYVGAKYTVGNTVECWGYFNQVSCHRVEPAASGSTTH